MRILIAFLLIFFQIPALAGITAKSYIVTDQDGKVLLEKNPDKVMPIASISKLFTVYSSLYFDMNEKILILPQDLKAGRMRSSPLRVGSSYTRQELIDLALISSDNIAAIALGRSALTEDFRFSKFTVIKEASGLNPLNVSTARELAIFAQYMMNSDIGSISSRHHTELGARKSTNRFIQNSNWAFHLSKTGYTNPAGGCLVVIFEAGGRLLTVVILGARDVPSRWSDLVQIRNLLVQPALSLPSQKIVRKKHKKR
jgi:D-alanyl-D-alanine endopeptidase (penicillin-binding protein 7)